MKLVVNEAMRDILEEIKRLSRIDIMDPNINILFKHLGLLMYNMNNQVSLDSWNELKRSRRCNIGIERLLLIENELTSAYYLFGQECDKILNGFPGGYWICNRVEFKMEKAT